MKGYEFWSLAMGNKGRKLCVCESTVGLLHRGWFGPDCSLDAVFVQMALVGTYLMAQVDDDQDFTLSGKERCSESVL